MRSLAEIRDAARQATHVGAAVVGRQRRRLGSRSRYLVRDFENLVRYGKHAPRAAQMITVDPREVRHVYYGALWDAELPAGFVKPSDGAGPALGRAFTGSVVGGDWDLELVPLASCPKYRACVERYRFGKSWRETGALDLMSEILRTRPGADGCHSEADVVRRFERLDATFREIGSERRLRRRRELDASTFRESGGVYMHIGRDATALFAGGGFHRLAIAKILELESIPAQLGVVHEQAIGVWKERFVRSGS